jgi:hypothetical protein
MWEMFIKSVIIYWPRPRPILYGLVFSNNTLGVSLYHFAVNLKIKKHATSKFDPPTTFAVNLIFAPPHNTFGIAINCEYMGNDKTVVWFIVFEGIHVYIKWMYLLYCIDINWCYCLVQRCFFTPSNLYWRMMHPIYVYIPMPWIKHFTPDPRTSFRPF